MKHTGMPTRNNTTPVESYADYREHKFDSVVEKIKEVTLLIKNSSLTESDKKLALLQAKFDIEKATI